MGLDVVQDKEREVARKLVSERDLASGCTFSRSVNPPKCSQKGGLDGAQPAR